MVLDGQFTATRKAVATAAFKKDYLTKINNRGNFFILGEEIFSDKKFDNFDRKSIKILNEIIEKTDCEIVVSSSWKIYADLKELSELYINSGIIKKPIGLTIDLYGIDEIDNRISEIKEYLERHPDIETWVAVDDLPMSQLGSEHFVQCKRYLEGIKQSGIKEKIIKILNG
jgi:uncharacterized membrane-anchored protein YjiN (DUF445 family)